MITSTKKTIHDQNSRIKSGELKSKKIEIDLIKFFWNAPIEALFGQEIIAPVIQKTTKSLESDRWRGQGIPYRKCGGRVLYRKSDVIEWIENHQLVTSTSAYNQEVNHD